ncbi:MAG: ribonuclease E/G [Proteobacteria bacterium]|nr:ribonuclease E/G [Pseudomonadota bacterium]
MSRRLLISALPGETRAAWLEDGRLTDLAILRDDRPWVADNVYLGRVTARDKGLAAAFVDIGLERPGFLPLAEAPKGLSEGDAVAVRVAREPGADKGARLTARGLPDALRATAETLRPPALLRAAGDPIAAALAADPPPEEIVLDDPVTFQRAKARLAERPELLARLRLDLDPEPPFEREGVEDAIEALLEPRVALPSGGYLLIEPVRTLTAVDVNTGGAEGRGGPAAQALAVDLEAAAEIPRQLRLRALSGLIAIDFLALRDLAARKRVVEALKRGLEDDPQPGRVFAPRRSGLVEMTRRRARPALHEILTEPCGIGGSGRVKDPVTRAYEALRALARAAARNPGRRVALAAEPRTLAALQGPAARARGLIEERLGRALDLRAQAGGDGFDIVLE